jgi:hypothetical protein
MASSKKPPLLAGEKLRPRFGQAYILAQSEHVTNAFGKGLGFVLMVLAILATPISLACIAFFSR